MNLERASVDLENPYCPWTLSKVESGDEAKGLEVWTRGQAWAGNVFLSGQELADWWCRRLCIGSTAIKSTFEEALLGLNGNFALVARMLGALVAAVDFIRSTPLFCGQQGPRFVVSDNARKVRDFVGTQTIDDLAAIESLMLGYVTGSDTLIPEVGQVQAGEYLWIEENRVGSTHCISRYYYTIDYFCHPLAWYGIHNWRHHLIFKTSEGLPEGLLVAWSKDINSYLVREYFVGAFPTK